MTKGRRPFITLFMPRLEQGGADRVMVSLANGLVQRGHRVDFVVSSRGAGQESALDDGVRLVDLGSSGATRSLPRLVAYLRRERPEALLATSNHGNVLAVLACRMAGPGTRCVLRQSNTFSQRVFNRGHAPLLPFLASLLYPLADRVVAGSQGVAEDLRSRLGLRPSQVVVVPNPLIDDDFDDLMAEPVDHSWFTAGAPPVVLAVGRLEEVKDYPTLLRAFAAVRSRRQCRLVVLGEGRQRGALKRLADDLGIEDDVDFVGLVDNPVAYMARSTVFVLSSRTEGLPGALIQAMACGTPVVSTDCQSGPRELIEASGHGTLVPVGDAQAVADAVTSAIESPARVPAREGLGAYRFKSAVDAYSSVLGVSVDA